MQIFLHSKFGFNRTADSNATAKKVNLKPNNFLVITLLQDLSQILSVEKSAWLVACLLNQFHPGVNSQGLYLVKLKFGGES